MSTAFFIGPGGGGGGPPGPPGPPGPGTTLQLQSFTWPIVGALVIPGDSAEHVIIPPAAFVIAPGFTGSVRFDADVNFYATAPSLVPLQFAIAMYLDGGPLGSRLMTMPPDDGVPLRVALASYSVTGGVAPGPHTIELRATSAVELKLIAGNPGLFAGQTVAVIGLLWSE